MYVSFDRTPYQFQLDTSTLYRKVNCLDKRTTGHIRVSFFFTFEGWNPKNIHICKYIHSVRNNVNKLTCCVLMEVAYSRLMDHQSVVTMEIQRIINQNFPHRLTTTISEIICLCCCKVCFLKLIWLFLHLEEVNDCKSDWLWVRSPLDDIKYLLKFVFSFIRSGVEAKAQR